MMDHCKSQEQQQKGSSLFPVMKAFQDSLPEAVAYSS
jgi:hypothetical protein